MKQYIAALDQGTTSSRAILYDMHGNVCSVSQKEITQIYPQAGYVEHDPMEILSTQLSVLRQAVKNVGASMDDIESLGITNQRETTVVWDKTTGKPIHNAIVWQCRRTMPICKKMVKAGLTAHVKETMGLVIDPYFSSTKLRWILDNVEDAQQKAERGDLLFGTVDTWLIWNLTKGKSFVTDYTNASRTMMFNIRTLRWDGVVLNHLNIPECMLPKVHCSSHHFGTAIIDGARIPITGVAGDQQASLFGQLCLNPGDTKNTYGTGCFMLMNIGKEFVSSQNGLITTLCATTDKWPQYAFEGSVFMGGAVLQWLRDEMGLLHSAQESAAMAESVKNNGGVYIVPAFTGIGAPYWDTDARGTIVGLTRGSGASHLVRASLEAIAYQTADVFRCMADDAGLKPNQLRVDGGASANDFLMQFQSDLLVTNVIRPKNIETTAMGAAFLAGLQAGAWPSAEKLRDLQQTDRVFMPKMAPHERENYLHCWRRAIRSASTYKPMIPDPAPQKSAGRFLRLWRPKK